ncbi:MAG TPA: hypothetical protein VHA70_01465 [Bauldia sp.]|nr:hypothetical protein [Bauldia sp.]
MGVVALSDEPLSFAERGQALLEQLDFRRAETEEEREAIFRLRYDCYLGENAIVPNFERRFTDPFDEKGNSWLFGLHLDDKLVASMRIVVATKEFPELPAMWSFGAEIMPELEAGKIIIDPTRFVVDKSVSRYHPHLAYMTARVGWIAGEYFQADTILATVRREHQAFYRRVFNYKLARDPRPYPTLLKPLSLMTLDYFAERDRVNRRYPFFRSTFFERRSMFERLQEPMKTTAPLRAPLRVVDPAAPARKSV